jgi:hypothetical protein
MVEQDNPEHLKPIKLCVAAMRERGFEIGATANGGGWRKLAAALDSPLLTKGESRRFVMFTLGIFKA